MASRAGRPPKPTASKVLQGTFRKDRANAQEPKPEVEAPTCPSWLCPVAKKEWNRVVPLLVGLKLLTQIDRAALAAYCDAWATWQAAQRVIRGSGLTMDIETKSGAVYSQQRPEVSIAHACRKQVVDFAREFGLTPSARAKVKAGAPDKPAGDGWDAL